VTLKKRFYFIWQFSVTLSRIYAWKKNSRAPVMKRTAALFAVILVSAVGQLLPRIKSPSFNRCFNSKNREFFTVSSVDLIPTAG